jgi:hypothetical protein
MNDRLNDNTLELLFRMCMEDPSAALNVINLLMTARGLDFGPKMVITPAVSMENETPEVTGVMVSLNLNQANEQSELKSLAIAIFEVFLTQSEALDCPPEYMDALQQKLKSLKNSTTAKPEQVFRIVS